MFIHTTQLSLFEKPGLISYLKVRLLLPLSYHLALPLLKYLFSDLELFENNYECLCSQYVFLNISHEVGILGFGALQDPQFISLISPALSLNYRRLIVCSFGGCSGS